MTSHSPASSPELPELPTLQDRPPRLHRLKTDPEVYQAVLSGRKTFEIRLNDRDFRVGDELLLMETTVTGEAIRAGAPLQFTGNELRKRISHVLSGYGLMPDWVCLSFEAGRASVASVAAPGMDYEAAKEMLLRAESLLRRDGHREEANAVWRAWQRVCGIDDAAPLQADAPKVAEAGQVEASEVWTRAMNAALTYRNADPEAIDEQDAWVNLINAIGALAATPASPQAPAPQAVVGEASDDECAANGTRSCRFGPHGHKGEMQCEWCGSPAPSASPHQGADALLLAAEQVVRADNDQALTTQMIRILDLECKAARTALAPQGADALREASIPPGYIGEHVALKRLLDRLEELPLHAHKRKVVRDWISAELEAVDDAARAALAHHQAPQQGEQRG